MQLAMHRSLVSGVVGFACALLSLRCSALALRLFFFCIMRCHTRMARLLAQILELRNRLRWTIFAGKHSLSPQATDPLPDSGETAPCCEASAIRVCWMVSVHRHWCNEGFDCVSAELQVLRCTRLRSVASSVGPHRWQTSLSRCSTSFCPAASWVSSPHAASLTRTGSTVTGSHSVTNTPCVITSGKPFAGTALRWAAASVGRPPATAPEGGRLRERRLWKPGGFRLRRRQLIAPALRWGTLGSRAPHRPTKVCPSGA